jgi:hypothetical protein
MQEHLDEDERFNCNRRKGSSKKLVKMSIIFGEKAKIKNTSIIMSFLNHITVS